MLTEADLRTYVLLSNMSPVSYERVLLILKRFLLQTCMSSLGQCAVLSCAKFVSVHSSPSKDRPPFPQEGTATQIYSLGPQTDARDLEWSALQVLDPVATFGM